MFCGNQDTVGVFRVACFVLIEIDAFETTVNKPAGSKAVKCLFFLFEQTTPTETTVKESNMQAEDSQQYSASAKQTTKSTEKQERKGNNKQTPSRKSPTIANEKEQASGKANDIKKNTIMQTGL
ncbi:uncharacterized protein LOC110119026, partial [Ceratitis capitata]|uniref:uncharacterized protein LOC110119026 n=1 Tax=Ceratitis capitata TaxID=7213 RepID=UPI000A1149AD